MNKKVDILSDTRTLYTYEELNSKGEKIQVEFVAVYPYNGCKNSLPNLWKKNGFTSEVLSSYWVVEVYATDESGCWGRYNPTIKPGGAGYVLNFDWVLPVTDENREKLLTEIERLAFASA